MGRDKLEPQNISKDGNLSLTVKDFILAFSIYDTPISDYRKTVQCYGELAKKLAEILDNVNYLHPF
ncbi:MAG: hypothetical protein IPO64_09650 [Bacteroidetes bacterium]|nr:hypothetical protein [Bacteroidota bacterium]